MNAKTEGIVLKMNNVATNDPCAVCGHRTDPVIGLDFFQEGTWRLVCDTCAEEYEPVLAEMRNLANKAFDTKQEAQEAITLGKERG